MPLMFIDIPRTEGSTELEEHMEKISEQLTSVLKSEEQQLHCICFVAQANNFSLSNEQIEYFQSVEHLFESTSTTDMNCFLTFADSGPAYVKEYLKSRNIRLGTSYDVNCSAFYGKSKTFSLYWESTTTYFEEFFRRLETDQNTTSLRLKSKNITPERREEIKSDIAKLHPEVKEELNKLGEIKFQVKTYEENKDDIQLHGNFSFQIDEIVQKKIDLPAGKHVTNCLQCSFICHDDCAIPDDDGKKGCVAMNNGFCTVCINKCEWWFHKNIPFIYEYKCIHVTKSYQEMKSSYEQEKGVTLEFEEYLEYLTKDIKELLGLLHGKVKKITDCKNYLQRTQENPLVKSFDETIDDMINAEKNSKEHGFERRIEMYEELKEYSNMIRLRPN
nr:uncharacterized protein LOC111102721 isoform X2 [Crassostrea virginica]